MKSAFSIYGVPLLGLSGLLLCLHFPQVTASQQMSNQETPMLAYPNPRQNRIMIVLLRQQAKAVTRCRKSNDPKALMDTTAAYNLVAKECTPTVFQVTHLPSAL